MQLFVSNPTKLTLAKKACGFPPPNTQRNGRKHMLLQVTMETGAGVSKVIFWQVAEGGSGNKTGTKQDPRQQKTSTFLAMQQPALRRLKPQRQTEQTPHFKITVGVKHTKKDG